MNNAYDALIEKLAELEHEQWCFWTKEVIKLNRNALITSVLEEQWSKSWLPYSELPEGQKDMDRIWAIKVMDIIKKAKSDYENE